MQASITTLEIALEVVKNNEPINRAEGNIAQADLELENARDFEEGLRVLRGSVYSNGLVTSEIGLK